MVSTNGYFVVREREITKLMAFLRAREIQGILKGGRFVFFIKISAPI